MKIGLLSDTHSFLDEKILDYFKSCDEIWHAGDIGEISVIEQLERKKPLRGVFGNIDGKDIQARFPEDLIFICEGLKILITHIGGAPPNYNPRIRKLLTKDVPDIFICGHSHILKIVRDKTYKDMLYLNPGAAGNHGFHVMKTIVRMEILTGEIRNLEVIELGKRGAIARN